MRLSAPISAFAASEPTDTAPSLLTSDSERLFSLSVFSSSVTGDVESIFFAQSVEELELELLVAV
jgi:hypothetical protein